MTDDSDARRVVKICENCGEPKYATRGEGCTCSDEESVEEAPPLPFNPGIAGEVSKTGALASVDLNVGKSTIEDGNLIVDYWEAKDEAEKCYRQGRLDAFRNALYMYDKFLQEEREAHGVKPKMFEHASDRLIEYLEEQAGEESSPENSSPSATEKLKKRLNRYKSHAEAQKDDIGGVQPELRAKISMLEDILDERGVDYE
jgi:hypothetical protein